MQYIFIVNSNCHKKRKKTLEKALSELSVDIRNKTTVEYTHYAGHAGELAANYAEKYGSECIIFACGGDGTVHEVANALAFRQSPMAVIPIGTGNDFAKTIYSKELMKKPVTILKRLDEPNIRPVDLLRIDSYDVMGNHLPMWSRYSLNIASLGLDTLVQAKAKQLVAKHPKSLFFRNNAYMIAAISCLLNGWHFTMDYSIELANGEMVEKKGLSYSLVSICNGRYYGGGFCPAPGADVSDGLLEVCIVDHLSRFSAMSKLLKYKKGKHIGEKAFTCYQSTSGIFSSVDSNLQAQGNYDGEDFFGHKIRYEVIPNAIRMAIFS